MAGPHVAAGLGEQGGHVGPKATAGDHEARLTRTSTSADWLWKITRSTVCPSATGRTTPPGVTEATPSGIVTKQHWAVMSRILPSCSLSVTASCCRDLPPVKTTHEGSTLMPTPLALAGGESELNSNRMTRMPRDNRGRGWRRSATRSRQRLIDRMAVSSHRLRNISTARDILVRSAEPGRKVRGMLNRRLTVLSCCGQPRVKS